MPRRILRLALPVGFSILTWQISALLMGPRLLPGPLAVALDFFSCLGDRAFLRDFSASALRAGAGIALALAIPFPLGLAMGASRRLDALLSPIVFLTYPIPKVLLLPILLVLLGMGEAPKILLVAVTVGYQVLVVTRDSVLSLDPRFLDSFQSLWPRGREAHSKSFRRLMLVWHVLGPAALPSAATSVRLASGTAVAVLFMAESFATQRGLGYVIIDAWGLMDLPRMFSGILAMGLLGAFFYSLANLAERRLVPSGNA
ncbi:MAG: ABC transporter permease subunit [Deltaproteobacteria bacterium]|jgi:NitT/TauT family transport system permease protein|nr:ABC transporter permease subunit [Deltaproteobacteria bacterium]